MKKLLVSLAALAATSTALAVEMPANYTHVGWIESDSSAKQWIDTKYVPKVSTVITGKFQAKARVAGWVSLLGVFNWNDDSKKGVLLRYNNGNNALEGIFCNDHTKHTFPVVVDTDYDFELKNKTVRIGTESFTYDDANCYSQNFPFDWPIYVFAENNANYGVRRHQPVRFYWLTFVDEDGTQRDFRPCCDENGKPCLWDSVAGKAYYNQATGNDFAYGGLTYRFDPATGVMTALGGGALTAEAMTGVTSIEKITDGTLEAGIDVSVDALTVAAGAFSFQDGTATSCAVSGALTLAGGAELRFDVTEDGVDAISAGSVAFTGEGTVKITVRGVGTTSLAADRTILSGGDLTDADLAKFTLAAQIPADLAIAGGNLVLTPKAAEPATWTGTSGNWSDAANWADGKKPGPGAPVTIDQTAGGTANQDISGLSLSTLTVAAGTGSFTTDGQALAISAGLDDRSAAGQTFGMALTLGMVGKDFSLAAAGDLKLTGDLTLAGSGLSVAAAKDATVELGKMSGGATFRKSGEGTVKLMKASPDFTGNIEITGGTVASTLGVPFPSDGYDREIRISNGGTLDLGPNAIAGNAINYQSRKLVLSGDGVDGAGAVTYGGGQTQYYAFRRAELADDATVGCTSGRWDVHNQNNVGSFAFNGHTLTKVGAGQFSLSGVSVTNGDQPAGLDIKEGTVLIENSTTFSGAENTLNVANGGRLQVYQLANPLGWTMNFADGARFDSQDGGLTVNKLAGPMTLGEGEVTFTVKNGANATVESEVSGAGKLKKADPGSLHLSGGAKTFTGGVEIAGGRLYAASSDQLPGYDEGKVDITGANAGLVLNSSGWTVDAFAGLLGSMSIADASGFVGYAADTETEITADLAHENGSVFFDGKAAPIVLKGDLRFPNGRLTVVGDVTVEGDVAAQFKAVSVEEDGAHLTLKDGVTLTVTNVYPTSDYAYDIVVGGVYPSWAKLTVENATIKADPLPIKGTKSSGIVLGRNNSARGELEVKAGGLVQHKICGGWWEWSKSAIVIRKGGEIDDFGGTGNNDGCIARDGYGYMENAGIFTMKGYFEVQASGSYSRSVGLLYNAGDISFSGEYDGTFDLQRGGTGVVYQTAGTIDIKGGGIQVTSQHGQQRGTGFWTVDGPTALTKVTTFYGNNQLNTEGILNLVNGGTLDYGMITARESNYDVNKRQAFYVNFGGGFLKPQKAGDLFKAGERYEPTRVTAFAGGLGVDVGEGLSATLNVPVRKPEGRGIASITPSEDALKEEYLGAPLVMIDGDGYGASAVALYDSTTRRVTGVKVVSPGCNYTRATVSLAYGKASKDNGSHPATVTLTDENAEQVCGGLVKKGAGTLVVPEENLPDNLPLALLDGVVNLSGRTYHTPVLTLGSGRYVNGSVIADKVVSQGGAYLPAGTLVSGGAVEVESGALSVDTRAAGLLMTLVQCADADGVRALMKDDAVLDWTDAVPVFDFNRANSQKNWGTNQILAYKGYVWNRGESDVTWTFGELFDDGTKVIIDGTTVLDFDESWNQVKLGTATLTPGAHTFEVRFGQIGGGAGPANSSNHAEWPANTLAFGIDYSGSGSYDISLYDHLTDISSGDVFTMSDEDVPFAPGSLTVEPGAAIDFNGDQQDLTYDQPISISAADLAAGRRLTFGNASVTFAPGTTVTVTDIDQLDLEAQNRYVIAEAPGGLAGFENLVFATPAPKGWAYELRKNALVLSKKNGLMILVY